MATVMLTGMETEILCVQPQVMSSLQGMEPLAGQVADNPWWLYPPQRASTLDLQMLDNIWHGCAPFSMSLDIHNMIQPNCVVTTEQQLFCLKTRSITHELCIYNENITLCKMTWSAMASVLYSGILQRTWLQISLQRHYLMISIQSSVSQWDYGLGRVGVSGNEISRGPTQPPVCDKD